MLDSFKKLLVDLNTPPGQTAPPPSVVARVSEYFATHQTCELLHQQALVQSALETLSGGTPLSSSTGLEIFRGEV